MKRFSTILIAILALALIPAAAHGLEYGGLGGKPANPREDNERSASIFIYELQPGDTYDDAVEVSNNTGETKTIRIGSVDSAPASDGAFACAQDAETAVDVGSWIALSSDTITLKNGESTDVPFTVTVPESASVGEHSGCVTIQEEKTDTDTTSGGVVLSFRSAIRVSVTIPGDIIKAITISGVSLERTTGDATSYTIRPSLTNTGNVSLDTSITSRLVSLFGVTNGKTEATYPVFPATTASWNFTVDQPFWGGWYKAEVEATYNANPEEGVGEESNSDKQTVTGASGYMFIAPTMPALLIELGLLAVFLGAIIVLIRRLRHRRTVKKHWQHHTVAEGESLQKIAKHYHVSWKKLASTNKLKAPYHVEPGDKLKVPPKPTEK